MWACLFGDFKRLVVRLVSLSTNPKRLFSTKETRYVTQDPRCSISSPVKLSLAREGPARHVFKMVFRFKVSPEPILTWITLGSHKHDCPFGYIIQAQKGTLFLSAQLKRHPLQYKNISSGSPEPLSRPPPPNAAPNHPKAYLGSPKASS